MVSIFFTSSKHRGAPNVVSPTHDSYFVTQALTHVPRSHIWEAIRLVWPESHWASDSNFAGIESRL